KYPCRLYYGARHVHSFGYIHSSSPSGTLCRRTKCKSNRGRGNKHVWVFFSQYIFFSFLLTLRRFEKMTVLAGIFTPIANVSVANNTFNKPSWNKISTICIAKSSKGKSKLMG